MMNWLRRILRRPDPREGEVCRHFRAGHFYLPAAGFVTYTEAYDYCFDCPASWYDSRPGPWKRRNWRWAPVSVPRLHTHA